MAKLTVTPSQKKSLGIAFVAALVAGFFLLRPYISLIIIAAIFSYLFRPVYLWFISRGRGSGSAATFTLLVTFFAILIPLTLVIALTVWQLNQLLANIDKGGLSAEISRIGNDLITNLNIFLEKIGVEFRLTQQWLNQTLTEAAKRFGEGVLSAITSSFTNIFSYITSIILYIFVFMSLLRNQDDIIESINIINPLGKQISSLYFAKMGAMTKAMVRGQFLIAIAQGVASAVGLYLAGIHTLFAFFVVLLTVLSFIPLGAGIVTITVGVIMILFGNLWPGIFLILWHVLFVTNIDNFMRPSLVPKEARLNSALLMLSVFAGLGIFGFMGIVVGPVIMIIITTTVQVFMDVYHDIYVPEDIKSNDKGRIGKVGSWAKKLVPRKR